jgi:hypothetical protein
VHSAAAHDARVEDPHSLPCHSWLLDANGPFKGWTLTGGHCANAKLEPLPFAAPPAELYDPLTYTV